MAVPSDRHRGSGLPSPRFAISAYTVKGGLPVGLSSRRPVRSVLLARGGARLNSIGHATDVDSTVGLRVQRKGAGVTAVGPVTELHLTAPLPDVPGTRDPVVGCAASCAGHRPAAFAMVGIAAVRAQVDHG